MGLQGVVTRFAPWKSAEFDSLIVHQIGIMMKTKERLFSVTAKDCDFEAFRGSGKGGQKKNKTSSAIRCRHRASGAIGKCESYREQSRNRKEAFRRMTDTKEFKQ